MIAQLKKKVKQLLFRFIELPLKKIQSSGEPQLLPVQSTILKDLQQNGIAITSFDELFGVNTFSDVVKEFKTFYDAEKVKAIREKNNSNSSNKNPDYKNYNLRASTVHPIRSWESVLLQKGLDTQLGNIASVYFKEHALLRYADYWISMPVSAEERNYSQNWHRDPEDQRILKVFVYLNDVTEKNGAFEYVKGSHLDGPYNTIFPYDEEHPNNYPEETSLRNLIPHDAFSVNEGLKGTVIICDTHGFHRGGYCKTGDRWMMTYMYNRVSLVMSNQFKIDRWSKLSRTQKRFYAALG